MNPLTALLTGLILILSGITVVLLIIGPKMLLHPRKRTAEFYRKLGRPTSPAEAGLPYEEINILAENGLKLNSWLIKAEQPVRGTLIYLHGVSDCKIDGLRFAALMQKNHFNVLLYDARAHGESDGIYCTYGYYEKFDCSRVIDYLRSRSDISQQPIGLFGISMGAAVALQTAAIDDRVSAVIAENSFASLRTIFDDYQRRIIKLPFHYLRNLVIKRSEMMAKFKANDVSPLTAVAAIHSPILFIFGMNDALIKHTYSRKLYEAANEPKELLPIESASHMDIWSVAGAMYEKKILSFFEQHLTKGTSA
ncbi:MAG TPA: alpha/beta fold hydrolase [Bacteroidota bacterium]|nr:alpha/beta fold hydrolase [Bacteroidota bacterium]